MKHGLQNIIETGDNFVYYLENFINNDKFIEVHNSKNLPYKLGHNRFSHLNAEEWKDFVNGGLKRHALRSAPSKVHKAPLKGVKLPDSVDW